jgi:hypothetical protein
MQTYHVGGADIYALCQELSTVYIKNKVLFQSTLSMHVPSFIAIEQELRALYMDTKVLTRPHLGYFTDALKTQPSHCAHSPKCSKFDCDQHVRTLYMKTKALICP